jgi:hypothetical protein
VATKASGRSNLTLYKDTVDATGAVTSTSAAYNIRSPSRVICLCDAASTASTKITDTKQGSFCLLAICDKGDIICLDGETLEEKWIESATKLIQHLLPAKTMGHEVHFAYPTTVSEVIQGIFKGRDESFPQVFQKINQESVDPMALVLVISTKTKRAETQYVATIAVRSDDDLLGASVRWLSQMSVAPMPSIVAQEGTQPATYQVATESGQLYQLQGEVLQIYELTDTTTKLQQTLRMPSVTSFLRLSERSVLSATPNSFQIVNPDYHSVTASVSFDISELQSDGTGSHNLAGCTIISYFKRLSVVVSVVDNALVAVQLEIPKTKGKKRQAEGLLIDSIGCGINQKIQAAKKRKSEGSSLPFPKFVPGTLTDEYAQQLELEIKNAEDIFTQERFTAFEELLASKFHVEIKPVEGQQNGTTNADNVADTPDWVWLSDTSEYAQVDRRWVIFAISKVFAVETVGSEQSGWNLKLELPTSNVVIYLIVAGHLTLSNVKSAFRRELLNADGSLEGTLIEDIVHSITKIDPTMDLLLNYLYATKLGERELIIIIRTLLESLDLLRHSATEPMKLLTSASESLENEEEAVEMQLDQLEEELRVAEHHLGQESGSQDRGLNVACAMLARCPASGTIQAMKTIFQPHETLAFIHLLRTELVRGAWTIRYQDLVGADEEEQIEPPPDGTISLIADLIARCVDAIGPTGWLAYDETPQNGHTGAGGFLTMLKLEVGAALEGLEEAAYLNGFISETVRYAGMKATAAKPSSVQWKPSLTAEHAVQLPLGLKVDKEISSKKVVSGGEVRARTKREAMHLRRKMVEEYSLGKLVV